ncbi:zf-HC2 domain-containing protein, partial [Terrabacter terrae]|uniref:zf-HC2 domain-containing protein n=1 Tax=Terrabacter terrae TaxID=318434 RepID=UPI0031E22544
MSDDIHALSGAYAVDALDDVERAHFERHLAGCSACRAEVDSLAAAATELSVLTEVPPPPSLRAKVLADIATVRPLPPVAPPQDDATEDAVTSTPSAPAAPPAPSVGRLGAGTGGRPGHGSLDEGTRPTEETGPSDELDARRRSRAGRGFSRGWRLLVAAATVAVLAVAGFTVWRQVEK